MANNRIELNLHRQIAELGAKDMEVCMQCGNCAASCPLSSNETSFPRKIYRYLQLGLKDKVLESPEPWLCYYCGECNTDCPRGAEPAETMMATRRWLTTQYDWTGLAQKFYANPVWEVGAFALITLTVMAIFLLFHGPVITDRVELNTFAPAHYVHIGDEIMILIVMGLLFSNAFTMFRKIMQGTKVPLHLYLTQAPVFIINYFTQKRWRKCGTGRSSAWWRHIFLFSGWVAMEVLVMIFLTAFQTDIVHPFWHPTRIVGYYATLALLFGSGTMLYSRLFLKEENLHRYSDFTDLFFLGQIFVIAITGIAVHITRLAGWPMLTYSIYVFHVAICVAMLMIMLPFGKLSHLLYRPLAIFLSTIKEKAQTASLSSLATIEEAIGNTFQSCMQCGACTASCPISRSASFSPRHILRSLAIGKATNISADVAAWECTTCNSCVESCPRGIPLKDLILALREQTVNTALVPQTVNKALTSLDSRQNPWQQKQSERKNWHSNNHIEPYNPDHEFCLFTCCSIVYAEEGSHNKESGTALVNILNKAGINFGSLHDKEGCCGELAVNSGFATLQNKIDSRNTNVFHEAGVRKLIAFSPHCYNVYKNNNSQTAEIMETLHYTELVSRKISSGELVPVNEVKKKVTFHDPCYLGRYNAIYDEPRQLINSIPGIDFVEMPNNRERSICCGGGGGGVFKDSGSPFSNAALRLQEAILTGADTLVVACPHCMQVFSRTLEEGNLKGKIKLQDLAELFFESIN